MPRHTAEEYRIAKEIHNEIIARDGRVTSRDLITELCKRTGTDPKTWNVIELWNAIKTPEKSKVINAPFTEEQKALILKAAETIARDKPVPAITPEDIRVYFRGIADRQNIEGIYNLTHGKSENINEILRSAGWMQHEIGGYVTSIPPATKTDGMEADAREFIKTAEDPESGIPERLHDIRFRHAFRNATEEEKKTAILEGTKNSTQTNTNQPTNETNEEKQP